MAADADVAVGAGAVILNGRPAGGCLRPRVDVIAINDDVDGLTDVNNGFSALANGRGGYVRGGEVILDGCCDGAAVGGAVDDDGGARWC